MATSNASIFVSDNVVMKYHTAFELTHKVMGEESPVSISGILELALDNLIEKMNAEIPPVKKTITKREFEAATIAVYDTREGGRSFFGDKPPNVQKSWRKAMRAGLSVIGVEVEE